MHLGPRTSVLFAEAHPGVHVHHKLSQMLRESFGHHFMQPVVFLPAEKAQPSSTFLPLADQARRIDRRFAVTLAFAITEETKAL